MGIIYGYGEDAFTFWALKNRTSDILRSFQDKTPPSDCLIFFRPSFGRSGGEGSAQFGEFDAILASYENIYLIESKWDNFRKFTKSDYSIEKEQKLRHRLFSWYLEHWDPKYVNNWEAFVEQNSEDFQNTFPEKKLAPKGKLLTSNLMYVLTELQKHCRHYSSQHDIKNVLLFFYNKNKSTYPKTVAGFTVVNIYYSRIITGNYLTIHNEILKDADNLKTNWK